MFIRFQAEQKKAKTPGNTNADESQSHEMSQLYSIMEKLPDTIIPYDFIRGNQRVWQAHLERISHFLLPGERIWWSQDEQGVIFHDGPHQPNSHEEGPETHRFRSSTLKSEEKYLKQCWETIMEQKIPVPTSRIIHDREDSLVEWETTNYLKAISFEDHSESKNSVMDNCIIRTDERSMVQDDISPEMDLDESEVMVGLSEHNPVELSQAAELTYTQDNMSTEMSDRENDSYVDLEITSIHKKTDTIQLTSQRVKVHNTDQMTSLNSTILNGSTSTTASLSVANTPSKISLLPPKYASSPISGAGYVPTKSNAELEKEWTPQTKLGKAVSAVLGISSEVRLLDKKRAILKLNPAQNKVKEDYLQALAAVQTKVSKEHTSLLSQFKEWQQKFFLENDYVTFGLTFLNGTLFRYVY